MVFEFDQRLKKRKKTGGTASLEVKYIPLHEPTAEEKEAARSPTAPSGALSLNKGNLTVYVESGSDLAKQANVRCRIRLQTGGHGLGGRNNGRGSEHAHARVHGNL